MNSLKDVNPTKEPETKVVWRILDGKAGHESQTLGLVKSLEKRVLLSHHDIKAPTRLKSLSWLIFKCFTPDEVLPRPDLIIGAGNRTHFALLAAGRTYRCKTVVHMQPSVPVSLFDLCLIPKHDSTKARKNVLLTEGVLNPILPATNADTKRGLFLIGGPSKHYSWDTVNILKQVITLIHENPEIQWTLTTSRRTPVDCTRQLVELSHPNLTTVPVEETPRGWVAEKLQECKLAWVSEDSVSMVYEALTAGALTGLLTLTPCRKTSRVQNSVKLLLEQKRVVHFEKRRQLIELGSYRALAEADRCADYIIKHLLIPDKIKSA